MAVSRAPDGTVTVSETVTVVKKPTYSQPCKHYYAVMFTIRRELQLAPRRCSCEVAA
jgi:hypothetical protein